MKLDLLKFLACPVTLKPLELTHVIERDGEEIIDAVLKVEGEDLTYRVEAGVPNLIPNAPAFSEEDHETERLQTNDFFGRKWDMFSSFGYVDDEEAKKGGLKYWNSSRSDTTRIFKKKALFKDGELREGVNVLDGGCGNGRLAYEVSQTGAAVIGVDVSTSVYDVYKNLKEHKNIHIVRGDLLRLPIQTGVMDAAYSIGVLQHTGDGKAATHSIARTLRSGGLIAIDVYGKGLWTYEFIDRALREKVQKMPSEQQREFSKRLAKIDRFIMSIWPIGRQLHRAIGTQIHLKPTEHHVLDWYAPDFAAHYTGPEVRDWFAGTDMKIRDAVPKVHRSGYSDIWRTIRHRPIQLIAEKL